MRKPSTDKQIKAPPFAFCLQCAGCIALPRNVAIDATDAGGVGVGVGQAYFITDIIIIARGGNSPDKPGWTVLRFILPGSRSLDMMPILRLQVWITNDVVILVYEFEILLLERRGTKSFGV